MTLSQQCQLTKAVIYSRNSYPENIALVKELLLFQFWKKKKVACAALTYENGLNHFLFNMDNFQIISDFLLCFIVNSYILNDFAGFVCVFD